MSVTVYELSEEMTVLQVACLLWEHRRRTMQNTTWASLLILLTPVMSRMIDQVSLRFLYFSASLLIGAVLILFRV